MSENYKKSEALVNLFESDFGQSGYHVRVEALRCELDKIEKNAQSDNARLRSIIEGLECDCEEYNGMCYPCQICRAKAEMNKGGKGV